MPDLIERAVDHDLDRQIDDLLADLDWIDELEGQAKADALGLLADLATELGRWDLTPRQRAAHEACLRVDEVLAGGAAGGGKTELILWHARWCAENWDGIRVLILRRSFPELRRSLMARARIRYLDADARWRAADKEWHFANGSIIEFGFVDGDRSVYQYDTAEYEVLIIDEATEFTEDEYLFLRARCRTTREKRRRGVHVHSLCATNPGGRSHTFFRNRFIVPTGYGRDDYTLYQVPGVERSASVIAAVPFRVDDNPHLDDDYIRRLYGLGERLRRQRLHGDWDTIEGAFFSEFSAQTHVWGWFSPDPMWRHRCGLDYGWTDPAAVLWGAYDGEGNLWIYREWYQSQLTPEQQAGVVLGLSSQPVGDPEYTHPAPPRIEGYWADPSIWRATQSGASIAKMYRDVGLKVVKGNNDRTSGWAAIAGMLALGEGDVPRLRIMDTCPRLIDALSTAQVDTSHAEDIAQKGFFDHGLDALRYLVASRGRPAPAPPPEPSKLSAEDQEVWAAVRRLAEENKRRAKTSLIFGE